MLSFASEAKALIAGGVKAQLDLKSLHLLMNFRYLPGDRTLFKGIWQVEPGLVMEWRVDGAVDRHGFHYRGSDSSADVLALLDESVALHLTADVEVACYLSGGIDSACISALARRHVDRRLRSFTLAVGDDPREAENAARTAQLLDMDNLQGNVSVPVSRSLPDLIWHLELPKVNALQVRELAGFAAREVKVAMSGLGGDELFLGYNAHRILRQAGAVGVLLPAPAARALAALLHHGNGLLRQPPWSEYERALRMLGSLGDWSRVYGYLRNVWDSPGLRGWIYGPRMLDAELDDAFAVLAGDWPDAADPVVAMARYEWRNKMVNDLLWQEDRCSMAVGLEVRVPFLDPVLAARVQDMPREILMSGGRPKAYMRTMLKPLLPQEVMQRPKSGFQVDAADFFSKELQPLADIFLSPERIAHYGLFNPAFVAEVRGYRPGKKMRWHYFMLYLMLATHLWLELFEQGRPTGELTGMH
jgi:asparagine synthase (glutamine-hydrolysing)